MTTEAMYLHLNGPHGLSDFTEEDLAEAYPSCVREGGAIDIQAVHAVDHAELGEDLEHDHDDDQQRQLPADGAEPDRAAEFERMQRARLEGATEGGDAIEQP